MFPKATQPQEEKGVETNMPDCPLPIFNQIKSLHVSRGRGKGNKERPGALLDSLFLLHVEKNTRSGK